MEGKRRGNLLIIDDDPAIIYLVVKELKEHTRKIFSARDGLEALEVFKNEEIHCAVCDIVMPGMDGVEVIRQIREEGNQCPIIFYTGHGTEDLMFEVSKYGAFDFVHKPDIKTLKEITVRGLEHGITNSGNCLNDVLDDNKLTEYWKLIKKGK